MNEYLIFNLNQHMAFDKNSPTAIFDENSVTVEEDLKSFVEYSGDKVKCLLVQEPAFYHNPIGVIDIDDETLKQLDNCFWLIDISFGLLPSNAHYYIDTIIKKYNFSLDKLIIIANSYNEIDYLKEKFSDTVNFICVHGTEIIAIKEFVNRDKRKKFIFLSRRYVPSRLLMFLDLKNRNILDNAHYSFFHIDNPYSFQIPTYFSLEYIDSTFQEYIKDNSSPWIKNIRDYWEENKNQIFSNLPHTILGEKEELNEKIGKQIISSSLNIAYSDSFVNLCVETNFDSSVDMFMPTEKTFKSIIFSQPFLVYSNPYFLKRLRRYGYKTFDSFFDESYDSITDNIKRIKVINDEVERLNNLCEYEFKKLMYKIDPIVNYNFNVIKRRLNNYNDRIEYSNDMPFLKNIFRKTPTEAWFQNDRPK